MNQRPFIVIGAGGHAKVVTDVLLEMGEEVLGLTDQDAARQGERVLGVPVLGADDVLDGFAADAVYLALGVGAAGDDLCAALAVRRALGARLEQAGYAFPELVHLDAIVGRECRFGVGAQAMAGAVVQAGTDVGDFAIINTKASLDHDCSVGAGAHIGPGATLGGGVKVGDGAYVGLGASVVQGVKIGSGALIAAGAVVTGNVADNARVAGVPARDMK